MPFSLFKKYTSETTLSPRRTISLDSLNLKNGSEKAHDEEEQDIPRNEQQTSEICRLRKKVQEVTEENNMLKLKIEILLDMVTEISAEKSLKEKELQKYDMKER